MTNKFEVSITGPQCCGKSRLIEEIKAKCPENFSIADGNTEHSLSVTMRNKKSVKLRVWHIPQVPGKPFHVEVDSVAEGVKICGILADYDSFQYENRIKPDYCNANGLQMWDESLTEQDLKDMELTDKWVDWYYEDEAGYYFDDPEEYLEWLATQS